MISNDALSKEVARVEGVLHRYEKSDYQYARYAASMIRISLDELKQALAGDSPMALKRAYEDLNFIN